ncbi:MAG: hypothetical protein EZS28_002741 [Streblomastix strix]|uniref:Uncharacterized protein n=1 Tax=Streblomastix strix TaxID=222440 RepID=A0A5J4X3C0_9EUKA|nr:MAG: hypothetical protein EZS28_002741 [Streblomastix strix]
MESDLEIQNAARAIVSFTDSYVQNKQRKQKEQSESKPSLAYIISTLQSLRDQIQDNKTCKSVTQIQKLLRSLTTLACYKIKIHFNKDIDRQRLNIRSCSRRCLRDIQWYCDAQIQKLFVNIGYGRVMFISLSTAGGIGEEQDKEIYNGLQHIHLFFSSLHQGKNNQGQSSFQPLPLLARRTEEQIEEEGGNEELEAQMNNNGYDDVEYWANRAKTAILNHFIHQH